MNVQRWFIAILALWWLGGSPVVQGQTAPRVVVSIKPLHALVAAVMQGRGDPELLISGGQSPHDFSLRPSDARKLSQAGLLVWVGDSLETSLTHVVEGLSQVRILTLMNEPGLLRLPARKGGVWDEHEHEEAEVDAAAPRGQDHPLHADMATDPHIWLSPINARWILWRVAEVLGQLDADGLTTYQANAQAMDQRLERLVTVLRERLAPVKDRPFVVFHDAYQYFESDFGLHAVGSVTISPERAPGAWRIEHVRQRLHAVGARCVFAEPQFSPKLIYPLLEGIQARSGVLDPLGADLPATPEAYPQLLERLGQSLVDCLRG